MVKEMTDQERANKIKSQHPELFNNSIVGKEFTMESNEQSTEQIKEEIIVRFSKRYLDESKTKPLSKPKSKEDRKKIMTLLKKDNVELYKKYNEMGLFSSPIQPDNKKLPFQILNFTHRFLGIYGSERLNVNLYWLFQACDILIPYVGEEWIAEQYRQKGKDWEKVKENFNILRKRITKLKMFYEHLENQRFNPKKEIKKTQLEIKNCFKSNAKRVSALQPDLYFLFMILVENTNLKVKKIPSDYFKILDHEGLMKVGRHKRQVGEGYPVEISEVKDVKDEVKPSL